MRVTYQRQRNGSKNVPKMFLLTVSLSRLPARAFHRGPVAFWSSAPTRDSSLPWTPTASYDAMAAASAPNDPTDDLHEQELPDFPDDGGVSDHGAPPNDDGPESLEDLLEPVDVADDLRLLARDGPGVFKRRRTRSSGRSPASHAWHACPHPYRQCTVYRIRR